MESWETALTWVLTITLGFSLAACAGLRAWLPMLVAGLTARFTDQIELGESYQFLESTPVLVLFGVATVVEMVGDKFPVVDHALDAFGTVARPVAGALLSAAVLYQVENPLFALGIGILVGAPTAAVPHAVKAASRGISTSLTAGIANPLLSIAEDVTALAIAALAVLLPIAVAFSVLVIGAVILTYLVRRRNTKARMLRAPEPAA